MSFNHHMADFPHLLLQMNEFYSHGLFVATSDDGRTSGVLILSVTSSLLSIIDRIAVFFPPNRFQYDSGVIPAFIIIDIDGIPV
jgi:hypothetical protein